MKKLLPLFTGIIAFLAIQSSNAQITGGGATEPPPGQQPPQQVQKTTGRKVTDPEKQFKVLHLGYVRGTGEFDEDGFARGGFTFFGGGSTFFDLNLVEAVKIGMYFDGGFDVVTVEPDLESDPYFFFFVNLGPSLTLKATEGVHFDIIPKFGPFLKLPPTDFGPVRESEVAFGLQYGVGIQARLQKLALGFHYIAGNNNARFENPINNEIIEVTEKNNRYSLTIGFSL